MNVLSKPPKLLASSKITTAFSTTVPKAIRNTLKLQAGDVIGFYLESNDKIILSTGGQNLLGSSSLTISNSITVPKKVRELLKLELGEQIGYYFEANQKIRIQT